jgi:hypothetical protein
MGQARRGEPHLGIAKAGADLPLERHARRPLKAFSSLNLVVAGSPRRAIVDGRKPQNGWCGNRNAGPSQGFPQAKREVFAMIEREHGTRSDVFLT